MTDSAGLASIFRSLNHIAFTSTPAQLGTAPVTLRSAAMPKTWPDALAAATKKQGIPPGEIVKLELDSSCRTSAVEVRAAWRLARSVSFLHHA
jgi:hypothetical protein